MQCAQEDRRSVWPTHQSEVWGASRFRAEASELSLERGALLGQQDPCISDGVPRRIRGRPVRLTGPFQQPRQRVARKAMVGSATLGDKRPCPRTTCANSCAMRPLSASSDQSATAVSPMSTTLLAPSPFSAVAPRPIAIHGTQSSPIPGTRRSARGSTRAVSLCVMCRPRQNPFIAVVSSTGQATTSASHRARRHQQSLNDVDRPRAAATPPRHDGRDLQGAQ